MSKLCCDSPPGDILLVASSGGHLAELMQLADLWPRSERRWVSFRKADAIALLANETTLWAYHPTNRSVKNFVRNCLLALRVVHRGEIRAIVTTGAGVAVPFAIIGYLAGVNVIYIESMARIFKPSLTGRLVYSFADSFFVQWPELSRSFERSEFFGTLFDRS